MTIRRSKKSKSRSKQSLKRRLERLRHNKERRLQLEPLESRQLLATGPALAGVQPDDGALLENGEVRNVAPSELTFLFNAAIDPSTVDGVRITRSGFDDDFERARATTDFNTNGTAVMDFEAVQPSLSGNGIAIEVIKNDLGSGAGPEIRVIGETIHVELNTNESSPTSAGQFEDAINDHPLAQTLVSASLRAGSSPNVNIAAPDINYSPIVLDGANRARVTTNFNAGSALEVTFTAVAEGIAGNGIEIEVTQRDRGGVSPPRISVTDGAVRIELNSNDAHPTTAQELIDAVNKSEPASAVVTASLDSGRPDTAIGNRTIDFSPLQLTGANDINIEPGFLGIGDTSRQVVFRFAEPLPDDLYLVEVLGTGSSALRSVSGDAFGDTTDDDLDNGQDFTMEFELDLGAQIVSAVPQPITRQGEELIQQRDEIHLYFNNDDLFDRADTVSTGDFSPNPTVVDPAFYQLIFVNETVQNTDDVIYHPESIRYDRVADLAVLKFDSDLEQLGSGPGTFRLRVGTDESIPLAPARTDTASDPGSGFDTALSVGAELRITADGSSVAAGQTFALTNDEGTATEFEFDDGSGAPAGIPVPFDAGMDKAELAVAVRDAINNADIGVVALVEEPVLIDGIEVERVVLSGTSQIALGDEVTALETASLNSLIISSEIEPKRFDLPFPGDDQEPGGRDIPDQIEEHLAGLSDATDGITTIFYNFQTDLRNIGPGFGVDPDGNPLVNSITTEQKQRAREAFELYGKVLGVQFVETADEGFTIATGDMRAIDRDVITGPGGIFSASLFRPGSGAVVMDGAEDWDDGFGATDDPDKTSWFEHVVAGIGTLLGIGFSSELPPLTLNSVNTFGEDILAFDNPVERVYPGDDDIVHGQHLFRPEGQDVDLYKVDVPESGLFSAEVIAERQPNSSLLDSSLHLYHQQPDGSRELIARNDDYFSNDSFLEIELRPGTYWVGVSSTGNSDYDPVIEDSGFGGTTEGPYDLRLNFRPDTDRTLRDATSTAFDGDGDGVPGGVFNFWFQAQAPDNTIFVDKASEGPGTGSLSDPFKRIDTAFAAAQPEDVVRIVGNPGADGRMETVDDNLAYEIGFNRLGNSLADGARMNVPEDVTVMIDAGAIFKLRRARIGVGSSSPSVDRSGSALQVLGTPHLLDDAGDVIRDKSGNAVPGSVFFTSIHDREIGQDSNPDESAPPAESGDWGGISFRNDIDRRDPSRTNLEERGIFLNHVNHADMQFGGGSVQVDGVSTVIAPIQMTDSRATATSNTITQSADAAISASPDAFLETNFHSPKFQFNPFTSDYQRIGPDIHGNTLLDNSINGLFVRVTTLAGDQLQPLRVAGRWNDSDIPHVLAEDLVVQGTPGGPIQDVTRPPVDIVTLTPQDGGELTAGDYNYRVTFVDADGNEGVPSNPTATVSISGSPDQDAIRLSKLPPAGEDFVARRIYRSTDEGVGPYTLVAEIDADDSTFVDDGTTVGGQLRPVLDGLRARLDARLAVDPGVIVKMKGGAIETRFGGQLIAEGLQGRNVVFTSTNDDRFGGSGTFDTTSNQDTRAPQAGDWGGLFIGHASEASIDHAHFAYGGGEVRVAGNFAGFNTIEVHQAEARITRSVFEHNADGTGGQASPGRAGRGANSDGLIFVKGAQPVILDNLMLDNSGPVININANALNSAQVLDPGRTSFNRGETMDSPLDRITGFADNQGPLVRLNRLANNDLNGLRVRGETLSTESVWDDTDIVHLLIDETIYVPDFHTFGGLRLESSSSESLVVKLSGPEAGFTATGRPLDINDRIGGSLQVVGQPGKPVILTALADDSAGAGFEPDGTPQVDTNNDGSPEEESRLPRLPTGPEVDNGTLIDNDVATDTVGHFEARPAAGGGIGVTRANSSSGVTVQGNTQLATNADFIFDFANFVDVGSNGSAVDLADSTVTTTPTLVDDDLVRSEGSFSGANGSINWSAETSFLDGLPVLFNTVTFTSDEPFGDARFISYLDEDVFGVSDDILHLTGTPGAEDFRAFTLDNPERFGFSHGGVYLEGPGLDNATYDGWAADEFSDLVSAIGGPGTNYSIDGNIDTGSLPPFDDPDLGEVFGPEDVTTAFAWTLDPSSRTATVTSFLELVAGTSVVGPELAGDWRGLTIEEFANDRNVAMVNEREAADAGAPGTNAVIEDAQFIGALAPNEKSGDENLRLGFEIHGLISEPNDVDVYSFDGQAGTEVWLDIDRTSFALDSVVELVDANGEVLARSDNSPAETENPDLLFRSSNMADQHVNPLHKSDFNIPDRYTTNPKDAGMRVVLPGQRGTTNTYFVRVRSSSPDLELDGGLTQGRYQLQVRLRELDEVPGSTVQHSDIRFATNGIEILGQPSHSPLVGEVAEVVDANGNDSNNSQSNAQDMGNLFNTQGGTLSIAGNLALPNDVDWYRFEVDFDSARQNSVEHGSVVFDLDYADGVARANTNLWVFDEQGNLILNGRDSNVSDDRPGPLGGSDLDDLSRGSVGPLDPFIGPVELPVSDAINSGVYFVAVSSNAVVSAEFEQFQQPNPSNPLLRLEPINTLRRVAEERFNNSPAANNLSNIAQPAQVPVLFDDDSVVEFNLGDVPLFVTQDIGANRTGLLMVDPFTGAPENRVGRINGNLEDVTINTAQGLLYGFNSFEGRSTDANTGNFHQVDPRRTTTTDLSIIVGDDGIETHNLDPDDPTSTDRSPEGDNDDGVGVHFDALTIDVNPGQDGTPGLAGYAVGRRAENLGVQDTRNLLYEFDPDTGAAISDNPPGDRSGCPDTNPLCAGAFTNIRERASLDTENDPIGPGNTVVLGAEATLVNANGQTIFNITDGQGNEAPGPVTFALDDGSGATFQFEFNAGPEVRFRHRPDSGINVRDGDRFFLDGDPFEFDTGSVLVVTADGSQVEDGDTITITDEPPAGSDPRDPITQTFEFELAGGLRDPSNTEIPFTRNDSNLQLINSITDAINGASFRVEAEALGQRISLLNENVSQAATEDAAGDEIVIEGEPGVDGTAVRIPVEESFDDDQFGSSIVQSVQGPVTASRDGERINFSGAVNAEFVAIVDRGVFTDITSDGTVNSGFTPVDFLAADSAEQIAARMVETINDTTPILAVQVGSGVRLQGGAFVEDADSPLIVGGTAPGGDITGLAFVGNTLFAVSDAGGLFRVINPERNGAFADYVETSSELLTADDGQPIQFMGLSAGPPNSEGGRFADTLFGVDRAGKLWAFDTAGRLQPAFVDGQASVETGLSGVTGLSFSNLDFNLWHETDRRENDPGHGVDPVFDGSRRAENRSSNNSFYFGYEGPNENGIPRNRFTNPINQNDFDFAGGAHGSLISNPFSLAGSSPEDRPTLYFNYFLDTENANADLTTPELMRDALRVYVSGDDGTWHLLSTNNSDRGPADPPGVDDEFDDPIFGDGIDVDVQETFDIGDSGAPNSWRQVRVGLDDFAGQDNLRLRFDFSTAAGMGPGQFSGTLRERTAGDELRAVHASRLHDGQTFSLSTAGESTDDVFEVDFGFTINAPTGAAIADGASFTVDGIEYVFDSDGSIADDILAVAGGELNDGDVFQVSDGTETRTFELEDTNVSSPDGVVDGNVEVPFTPFDTAEEVAQAIADAINDPETGLDVTATVDGQIIRLAGDDPSFSPGTTPLRPPTGFVIPFAPDQSSEVVAANIEQAIRENPPPVPVFEDDLAASEPNDSLSTALDTNLTGTSAVFRGSGSIGDNTSLATPETDVDMLAFDLQIGDQVAIDVDANELGTDLNPALRLFDANGNELAFSTNEPAPGEPSSLDPFISFTAPITGTYFAAVSGEPNLFYNPLVPGSGVPGSTGDYEIEVTVTDAGGLVHRADHRINLPNAGAVTPDNLPDNFIEGAPGTASGFPVNVNLSMNAVDVADAVATSLASFFADGVRPAFKTYENIVNVVGHSIAGQDLGPFGSERFGTSTSLFGDQFGAFAASTNFDGTTNASNPGALKAQDNAHEGVFLDDIIIGFAERGEMTTGTSGSTSFVGNAQQPDDEIDVGPYQLEIRRSQEFGVSVDPPLPTLILQQAFDTNDRHGEQVTLEALSGAALADGQSFVISDGVDSVTFEFDDTNLPAGHPNAGVAPGNVRLPFSASMGDNQIAELIRDTINGSQVQSLLDITAGLADATVTGERSTSRLINLYGTAIVRSEVAASGVSGSINDVFSSFDSDSLFEFENQSGSGEQIASIEITLPQPQFFDPEAGSPAGSGPDISPASDPVGAGFTFRTVNNSNDTVRVDFSDFAPNERFIFGVDVDPSNDPRDNVGALYTIVFDSGRLLTGRFTATGAGPGEVATLDLGSQLETIRSRGFGDENTERPQGHISIAANRIANSQEFGIVVDAGSRDISNLAPQAGQLPHPAPVRVTAKRNQERLVPGATLFNNLIVDSGTGGIRFSGDTNPAGEPLAPIPYGRIFNNTIVGRNQQGVGIQVDENASPTLLNNIVASLGTGISVDGTSNSVLGGTVFKGNGTDTSGVGLGSFPMQLTAENPLFADAATGNFNLAAGSQAIDSAVDSLQDRPEIVEVKEPLGLRKSPILAPETDALGQRRVDDPSVNTPPGQGANVFKDRGALDRADFVGPAAVLLNPRDNDALGRDRDDRETFVELVDEVVQSFAIQLIDGVEPRKVEDGTGPDDSTVRSSRVTLLRDGERLVQGVDYSFNYDATNNIIRLTPLAGIWQPDRLYEIDLSNSVGIILTAPDGTSVTDGQQFDVTDKQDNTVTFEYESGYSLRVPRTLTIQVPDDGGEGISDGDIFTISENGTSVSFEFDRNGVFDADNTVIPFSKKDSANDIANKIVAAVEGESFDLSPRNIANFFGRAVHLGSKSVHSLDTAQSELQQTGQAGGIEAGQTFTIDDGTKVVTFEFVLSEGTETQTERQVVFSQSQTREEIAETLAAAIRDADVGLDEANHTPNSEGLVHVAGTTRHIIDAGGSELELSGEPGVQPEFSIKIPTVAGQPDFGAIGDGQTFVISNANESETFELDSNDDFTPGNIPVPFSASSTTDELANAIAIAIRNQNDLDLSPTNEGHGVVTLNGTAEHTLDASNTGLTQLGEPGVPAAQPVFFVPGETFTLGVQRRDPITSSEEMAISIAAAINRADDAGLFTDVQARPQGEQVVLDGVEDTTASGSVVRSNIRDVAGNPLKSNRNDGSTRFTILIGTGLDYGDAPEPYPTLKSQNGARHKVVGDFFLGTNIDVDIDGQPSVAADGDDNDRPIDDEDGVVFTGSLNAGAPSQVSVTASKDGLLDAWIDFNRDGDWDDEGEQIFISRQLVAGANLLTFDVPGSAAPGTSYARFRLSSQGALAPTGPAPDGEVEDYRVELIGNPWRNPENPNDVSGDGVISPIDVLLLVNELNRRAELGLSDQLPIPPVAPPPPPPFFDVSGDGRLSAFQDVMPVLNALNDAAAIEGESSQLTVSGSAEEAEGELGSVAIVDHRLPAADSTRQSSGSSRNGGGERQSQASRTLWNTVEAEPEKVDYGSLSQQSETEEFDELLNDLAAGLTGKNDSHDDFFSSLGS